MTTLPCQPAIFMHIQKTAGTALVNLVRSTYGNENIISHGDYLKGVAHNPLQGVFSINEQVLAEFERKPFLSGHFGFDFTKRYMQGRYSFTFLRDPVERILSFYYYCKNQKPEKFNIYKFCQQTSLDEFLKIGLTETGVKSFIWNHQVWQLAYGFGNFDDRSISTFQPRELLYLAVQHLKEFSYVGFAETFERDRDAILKDLGIGIPLENVVVNANPGRPVFHELPHSTKIMLMELTELDRALYEKAWSKTCRASCGPHSFPQKDYYDMAENLEKKSDSLDPLLRVRKDYLDLLQTCLTGSIYRDPSHAPFGTPTYDPHIRAKGLDWPAHAQTMIGDKRLANLRTLTESVIADNVPGDFIETGVWRGGACIMMRAILYAYGITDRNVWVADSFEGLPVGNALQYPADAGSDFNTYRQLAVSLEDVQENFRSYGFLDGQTKFLKGWFKDTLPGAPIGQLALMRLDGDMYESTIDALNNLYPKLSHRGYVIIDDYHVVVACKTAVHDYWDKIGIKPELLEIDGVGVYWRKSEAARPGPSTEGPNTTVVAPDTQLARLKEALIEVNRKVTLLLNRSLAERDEEVVRLERSLAEQDEKVARLERTLAEQDEKVTRLDQSLSEREAELDRLQVELDRLQVELKTVYSSASWRITNPFRVINKFIRGI